MSENGGGGADPEVFDRPRTVSVAALLCGAQGVLVAVLGVVLLALAVFDEPEDMTRAVTGALTVSVLAVLPLAAGHGLWRLRRWSRGPAVVTQLLALPVAFTLLGSGRLWPLAAAGLGISAVAVLGCLVNPTATAALGVGQASPDRAG
ncbi:hypothetical protein [Streptomyces hainanensis]|uniref:Integral membrane protein n=1 Tax=Streptomyces hainanensis TaxID=402648 RepID=A0A4R4THX9_9ACTN|nr:hypothetical protein [Streptomyces hainanensis]TDC77311.1 hypothetical protein E1283_07625 [Streptomyces hainanensis]